VLRVGVPHADSAVEGGLNVCGVEVVEDIAVVLVVRPFRVVGIEHRVRQRAPGRPIGGWIGERFPRLAGDPAAAAVVVAEGPRKDPGNLAAATG